MAVIDFLAAAVQMPQHGREVDAGGIHQLFVGQIEGGPDGEQLSAHRADLGIHLPGVHQRLDEVGQQQDVGIERQNPLPLRQPDGLILRRRESQILVVVVDAAAVGELFQNVHGAVGRRIVDHHDFHVQILLFQNRFEATLDKSAAVVSDYCYGNQIVGGHCVCFFIFSRCARTTVPAACGTPAVLLLTALFGHN